jgi:hypothetical protein
LGNEDNGPTGLQVMSSQLLDRRPQIHTLAYMASGRIRKLESKTILLKRSEIQQTGLSY